MGGCPCPRCAGLVQRAVALAQERERDRVAWMKIRKCENRKVKGGKYESARWKVRKYEDMKVRILTVEVRKYESTKVEHGYFSRVIVRAPKIAMRQFPYANT